MNYEQYNEWTQFVVKRIAEELEKFTFEAGSNSSAFFEHVGVDVVPVQEEAPAREETWGYVVYGTVYTIELSALFGPALAARLRRAGGGVPSNDSLFVQSTEVLTVPDVSTRTKRVTYYVTTMTPAQIGQAAVSGNFSQGIYRGGLKLTCEFYQQEFTGEETFIRNYTFFVRQNGDSVTLTAPDPNKTYYLRIVAAERL